MRGCVYVGKLGGKKVEEGRTGGRGRPALALLLLKASHCEVKKIVLAGGCGLTDWSITQRKKNRSGAKCFRGSSNGTTYKKKDVNQLPSPDLKK